MITKVINGPTNSVSNHTLALETIHLDIRQMVQKSEFTIHGSSDPIENHANRDKFLAKITIPFSSKETFRIGLQVLAITESTLFPDLEHLACEIKEKSFAGDFTKIL